jgi:hypothetical protein
MAVIYYRYSLLVALIIIARYLKFVLNIFS